MTETMLNENSPRNKAHRIAAALQPPFTKERQLNHELDSYSNGDPHGALPSQPRISMALAEQLSDFLLSDLSPTKLNQLAPQLWLCSAPTHTNIPPLHNHAVHGRNIVVSEDPALHLVWDTGRIFIKPLPTYLLSHTFWTQYLLDSTPSNEKLCIREAGMGLLRSYFYCIRHETDFRVAQQPHLSLLPMSLTWQQWCDFAATFNTIENAEVAPRYHYGKLQLSRLHWLVRMSMWELNYYYIDGGYGESFARYYGPLLFVFGILSVLLSAMQVGMAVEQLQSRDWVAFWSVCRWFSVISLLISATVTLYLVASFVVKSMDELIWAARAQYRARPRSRTDTA
ncbi:MAG: hypothetical protein Q9170_002989 [Blastenia crenularia]